MRASCLLAAPLVAASLVVLGAPHVLWGDDDAEKSKKKALTEDNQSVTQHTVTIDGAEVAYTATAGTLVLKSEEGKAQASIFHIAYTRDDVEDPATRPITFCFNGGPGSSSVWLHMGVLGPRRVLLNADGASPPPPYQLIPNAESLLDVTDLVFIDPVSTGFSRASPGQKADRYHGVDGDVESVADFIRLYATRNGRWGSPKLLAGESYGTTRAAALASHLQDRLGMNLNGLLLISSILNFQTARFDQGNDLPYVLFLPTFTATAWFHGKLPEELQKDRKAALAEAEAFAEGDYLLALMQGSKLPDDQRSEIAKQLARLTGLSQEFVEQCNLRVSIFRFVKELLREERRTVGRFDSRFKGRDSDAAGEGFDYDPSYAILQSPFTTTLNGYLRGELEFESDLPYEILTGRVRPWDYGRAKNRYLNVAGKLRRAMTKNPHLQVFVANGYYDLATPYFATEHTFNHLGLDPDLADHVTMTYYDAGHMMYIHEPSLKQLKRDMAAFVRKATRTSPEAVESPH